MIDTPESLITELAFKLILDSEEAEGFELDAQTTNTSALGKPAKVNKTVILEFLKDDWTKLAIKFDNDKSEAYLVASNQISSESIKITGLAHHYLALLKMVDYASQTRKNLEKNKNAVILSEGLIKQLNLVLQLSKAGEIGIGEYRNLDYLGRPVEVKVSSLINDEVRPVDSIELCLSKEVKEQMDELIAWVNQTFCMPLSSEEILKNVSRFHARFVKIHPFRDGNGRTARLLTNYLLLSLHQPLVTIPINDKNEYINALTFANSSSLAHSCKDVGTFDEFLIDKYKQFVNNPNCPIEQIASFFENFRQTNDKYIFIYNIFKNHQIAMSSSSSISNILNDYGQKSLHQHIDIGSIRSMQIEYENIN